MTPLSRPRPGPGIGGLRSRLMKGPRAASIMGKERQLGASANVVPGRLSSGMAGAGKRSLLSARSKAASALGSGVKAVGQ